MGTTFQKSLHKLITDLNYIEREINTIIENEVKNPNISADCCAAVNEVIMGVFLEKMQLSVKEYALKSLVET